ncbi:MAG: hypothetical protein ACF8LL_11945 [Phycisphaerales bacterium]
MHQQPTQDIPFNQSRKSGIVIAAIGLQLLLCSIASAANAAGDSIDRSARRLPAQMAQALREMVDRSTTPSNQAFREESPGFTLHDSPLTIPSHAAAVPTHVWEDRWAERLLNLPPPPSF